MSGGADAEATARATYRDLQTQKRKDEAEQFKVKSIPIIFNTAGFKCHI